MSKEFITNIDALFGKMEGFVSTKSVVGEPIHIGDVILLPLIEVSFGGGAGGFDGGKVEDAKAINGGGGGGGGGKIIPSAVIVIQNGTVQLVNVKNQDSVNKLIDMAPGILAKINSTFFDKKKTETDEFEEEKI